MYAVTNDVCTRPGAPLRIPNLNKPHSAKSAKKQRHNYPKFGPLILDGKLLDGYRRLLDAMNKPKKGEQWSIVSQDDELHFVYFTATSKTFRWTDDVVVEVIETNSGQIRFDARSKTRKRTDLGNNVRRIKHLWKVIERSYDEE
mmetsp:Transcript_11286/g.12411  ORF Transcript_11286/g.12411 Transcript_11286/m.12411 type:complete len:144 (+) Transcript_11286:79-510(+)